RKKNRSVSLSGNKAVIFGMLGLELTPEEKDFFREEKPFGFILFARNIDNPQQVIKLVEELKGYAGGDCPILIDQEGGRVARLKPPHWPKFPPAGEFAAMAEKDMEAAKKAVYDNSKKIAAELVK